MTILNVEPGGTSAVKARLSAAAVRAVGDGQDRAVTDPHGDQRGPASAAGQGGVRGVLHLLVQGGLHRPRRPRLGRGTDHVGVAGAVGPPRR